MKYVLVFAAIAEFATGVALLVFPALVSQWLLGGEPSGLAVPIARVTGIALMALGVACWPGPPIAGMLTYSTLVMLYLGYGAITGNFVGPMLWPAVILHAILTALMLRSLQQGVATRKQQRTQN